MGGAPEASASSDGRAVNEILLLPVRGDLYAISLADAREVIVDPRVTRLPAAPPALLGVLNVRGEVVPVADTAALLGLAPLHAAPAVVVTFTRYGLAALAASDVPSAAPLGEELDASDLVAGVTRHAIGSGRVATLLDLDRLVEPERIGR